MHYLVTGGAGFIGSHVVEALLGEGARVTIVDNFDPFYSRDLKLANLAGASQNLNVRLVETDIREPNALCGLESCYDCIVHLAGRGGVRPSIADPVTYQNVNVGGTHNLLEFARRCRIPQFIFASSSSVYGVNPNTPWREDETVLRPISPYASTKLSAELLGHVYSHLYGIRFLALRFFTVYGPRQRPDLAIRKFAEMILAGEPIPIFGKGDSGRDYTYIDDIVAGVRAAMEYRATGYEVINLGNRQTISLMGMVKVVERALNRKAMLRYLPEQPGDLRNTCADIAKAGALLAYSPKTPFAEGITRFTHWLRLQNLSDSSSVEIEHELTC